MPVTRLRHTRRLLSGWMLGVMLVLLPLRGWAEVTMHLGGPVQAMVAPAQTSPVDSTAPVAPTAQPSEAAWTPPCHAGMDGSAAELTANPDDGCSLCSLCHASALCANAVCSAPEAASSAAPSAAHAGHCPPQLPVPERPPRA